MKVIAFNGSPRKEGNTYLSLKKVAAKLEENGIETEIINVGSMNFSACKACYACTNLLNETCPAFNDGLNELVQKAKEADGIILASPVYFGGVAGGFKSFLDRFFLVTGCNGLLLRQKVGASVVTLRRSGGLTTLNELNHYLAYSEMVLASSNYWTIAHGSQIGEVEKDNEGAQIMEILGENMAWLINSLSKSDVPKPTIKEKSWCNFIRE